MRVALRFGIMCSGDSLVETFARAVAKILAIPGVELALIILDENPPVFSSRKQKLKKIATLNGTLWALYQKLFPLAGIPAYRHIDMSPSFARVPRIQCKVVRKGKFSEYFTPEDVEAVRRHGLDFILRFGFGIIRGEILQAPRYGVWSYHHGDELKFRGGPPAFWEIFFGEPVTAAILQRLTDKLDGGVVLQKCFVKTNQYSYAANLDHILKATSYMPARVCRDILNGHGDYVNAAPSSTKAPIHKAPNDFQMASFFLRTGFRFLRDQAKAVLFSENWNVGFTPEPASSFLTGSAPSRVDWAPYKKSNAFVADPFVVARDGSYRLFAEEFNDFTNRGSIVDAEIDRSGKLLSPLRLSMDTGYHMSYPHVFEHEGECYCTPECAESRGISLYRFAGKAKRWQKERVLIEDFAGIDPTPIRFGGRWWLFCTNADEGANTALYIWHSPDLSGPWTQHDANPVKVDVRSSRPAGPFFFHNGELYRPAQDCSETYGGSLRICRIVTLTPTEFREEEVAHIRPVAPYPDGIHTLAQADGLTVIDGKRMVFAPALLWRRLAHKLRRLTRSRGY